MTTLSAPAGNPAALDESVRQYLVTERALERAASDIASSIAEGSGRAIEAASNRSGKAQSALAQAHGRYQGARAALQDYSVELHRFHADANAAIRDEEAAQAHLHWAQYQLDHAEQQLRVASMNPNDPYTTEEWRHAHLVARNAVDHAQQASADAHTEYAAALSRLDSAAHSTMRRIVAAFEGTNDGWRDYANEAINAFTHLLDDLAEWAISFLQEVLTLVAQAVAIFLVAVLVAAAVIAFAIVLVQLLVILAAVVAAIVVLAIVALVAVLAELMLLFSVGARALLTANTLGLKGLDRIRFVVNALEAACPPLALFILSRIENELSKPVPDVREIDPSTLTADKVKALGALDTDAPEDVADLLEWAGIVDDVGGDAQAVVDVARIVDEQGDVSWIVTLPSTEDWVLGGDKGAPNDLDADLMLILYPELRCQYEEAVLKAMGQAGIPQGDPVVLAGWSLGGIMGGSLIESHAGGYNYAGLVCAGSPIDHLAISPNIPVLQVKHMLDPVHRADMIDDVPDTAHHLSVWDGPRSDGASTDIKTGNLMGHKNTDYVDTLQDHLRYNATNGGPDLNSDFAVVLPVDDPTTPEHVVVEHTQYAFSE
ncbi:hypothetical protein [Demequina lutea]|uniref:Uncharacterized protein n=1 Tax=Demequina lutea TaxID=431489 RepID=A0A7Y9ZAV2_9MICO|nr:hypothetical protein [Demequina lutea]NYI39926.1 hypothetical protein [Demequina lutea]